MKRDLNSTSILDFPGDLSPCNKSVSQYTDCQDLPNIEHEIKPQIIILTSEGGSGHQEAMQDSKAYYENQGIPVKIIYVLPPTNHTTASWMKILSIDVGKFGVHYWNRAQIAGNMQQVKKISNQQRWVEWLFETNFERKMFNVLAKYPTTMQVIDTQAINTHRIIKAIAKYNKIQSNEQANKNYNKLVEFNNTLRKYPFFHFLASNRYKYFIAYQPLTNPVMYKKRMTDLPNQAEHFFHSIRKIRTKDMPFFSLEAPRAPNIGANNYERNLHYYRSKCSTLWERSGKTRLHQIAFTDGPIKKPFQDLKEWHAQGNTLKNKPLNLEIKCSSSEELKILQQLTSLELFNCDKASDAWYAQIKIPENVTTKCIMLGSQAIKKSTLAYVEAEIENHTRSAQKPVYLFVFCGRNNSKSTLYTELINRLQQHSIPDTLTIIPLSYQEATMIASLYARCDTVIIRAGGISCMEIEATSTGNVYFHAESKKNELTESQLKNAMLYWEIGNYEHVQETLGKNRVQLINPYIYRTKLLNLTEESPYKKSKESCYFVIDS